MPAQISQLTPPIVMMARSPFVASAVSRVQRLALKRLNTAATNAAKMTCLVPVAQTGLSSWVPNAFAIAPRFILLIAQLATRPNAVVARQVFILLTIAILASIAPPLMVISALLAMLPNALLAKQAFN